MRLYLLPNLILILHNNIYSEHIRDVFTSKKVALSDLGEEWTMNVKGQSEKTNTNIIVIHSLSLSEWVARNNHKHEAMIWNASFAFKSLI